MEKMQLLWDSAEPKIYDFTHNFSHPGPTPTYVGSTYESSENHKTMRSCGRMERRQMPNLFRFWVGALPLLLLTPPKSFLLST